ncbi:hypothetical protein [Nostoc sp. NOS(2021)]|uniref:hypothetical protein n=1 Tax=Nostoc sp. NOS(2021) TaxID=2815407 RepID=UPI0025D5A78D|nr:hypothetical protein [Nostoc sp. NOS(2021)]
MDGALARGITQRQRQRQRHSNSTRRTRVRLERVIERREPLQSTGSPTCISKIKSDRYMTP